MAVREIRLLGDPILRTACEPVIKIQSKLTRNVTNDLRDTLLEFRRRRGFGRGIAAPQIGLAQRILYVDFEYSGAMINPEIARRSRETFELWDDCFSFPDILVRVRRHRRIIVRFLDQHGSAHTLTAKDGFAELLQHEIDHLNGILAIDRAVDSKHIILRSEFNKLRNRNARVF